MKKSSIVKWMGLVIVVLLAVAAYRLLGTVIGAKVEQWVAQIGLTPNQVAAHGPLPGDVGLYAKELDCRNKIYIGMNESARRAFWDPATKKLSMDESWVIHPMQKGQTSATAPSLIGDWVGFQLNGIGSDTIASTQRREGADQDRALHRQLEGAAHVARCRDR